jgi:hypothetical protein
MRTVARIVASILGLIACLALGIYWLTRYEFAVMRRTTEETRLTAERVKSDLDRRFPIGTPQSAVAAYFTDNRMHDEGGGGDVSLVPVGEEWNGIFGCGYNRMFVSVTFAHHQVQKTEIFRWRPDCL